MAENTKIEWCDSTFNPWVGCTKVGPGCDHCYAEGWAKRSGLVQWGPGAERRRTSESNWRKPLQWNAQPFSECTSCGWRGERYISHWDGEQCPHCREVGQVKPARRRVFCASLADVFDNEVPVEWRTDLFDLISATPNLDWLLVTKRIGNAKAMMADALHLNPAALSNGQIWPLPNVWLGITVVNQEEADRDIPKLLQTPAAVRFLSMEPLLGPVELNGHEYTVAPGLGEGIDWLTGNTCQHSSIFGGSTMPWLDRDLNTFPQDHKEPRIHWVIVGGESGPKARPMHPQWVRDIRNQCEAAGVPFLFKQWGEFANAEAAGISLDIAYESKSGGFVSKTGRFFGGQGAVSVTSSHSHVFRIGKKQAGRLLDGCEHNGFPEVAP